MPGESGGGDRPTVFVPIHTVSLKSNSSLNYSRSRCFKNAIYDKVGSNTIRQFKCSGIRNVKSSFCINPDLIGYNRGRNNNFMICADLYVGSINSGCAVFNGGRCPARVCQYLPGSEIIPV